MALLKLLASLANHEFLVGEGIDGANCFTLNEKKDTFSLGLEMRAYTRRRENYGRRPVYETTKPFLRTPHALFFWRIVTVRGFK